MKCENYDYKTVFARDSRCAGYHLLDATHPQMDVIWAGTVLVVDDAVIHLSCAGVLQQTVGAAVFRC